MKKNKHSPKSEGAFNRFREALYQVNLATEHYAQIIGLSKGRRYWRSVAYLLKVVR